VSPTAESYSCRSGADDSYLSYLRDESQGQDDTIVADQVNIVWSGKVLNWITRVYPPKSANAGLEYESTSG